MMRRSVKNLARGIALGVLLVTAVGTAAAEYDSCNPNMGLVLQSMGATEAYESYLDRCEPERREQNRKEREARQKEWRELLRRVAAGDREAIVKLRGDLLIGLFDTKAPSDDGLRMMRMLLDELARLEGCGRT